MTDVELVNLAQNGDRRAADVLARRYERRVTGASCDFFIHTGTRDDIIQEAWIGFLKAVRLFNPDRGVPFGAYVDMSVRRWLIWVIRREASGSRELLTRSAREPVQGEEGEMLSLIDCLPSYGSDPADVFERREEVRRLTRVVSTLSVVERRALTGYVNGLSYAEMEGVENSDAVKRVDNALQRARVKLRAAA